MCVSSCTLRRGVYVWKQTESAFTERFMLIVMNGSCWSGKGEGQAEGETRSEIGRKKKSKNLIFLVCFSWLVPGYYFTTSPTNYLLTFFLLCGVYLYSWSQFTLMPLDYLGSSLKKKKGQCFFFYSSVACDTRLWSHFSGSILLPAGHFRSGLQLPYFHPHFSEVRPSVFLRSPPSCPHSPTLCGSLLPDALTETSTSCQQPSFWHH